MTNRDQYEVYPTSQVIRDVNIIIIGHKFLETEEIFVTKRKFS